jgi:hypothetical protein
LSGPERRGGRLYANNGRFGYSSGASAFQHGLAVVVKLRKINMGVRIDQFHFN